MNPVRKPRKVAVTSSDQQRRFSKEHLDTTEATGLLLCWSALLYSKKKKKKKVFAGWCVFAEALQTLYPSETNFLPSSKMSDLSASFANKKSKFYTKMTWKQAVFPLNTLYLHGTFKSTMTGSKPLDNIFLDSFSLHFSFSVSSFAGFSSFSKDCDNWIWIFSCQE